MQPSRKKRCASARQKLNGATEARVAPCNDLLSRAQHALTPEQEGLNWWMDIPSYAVSRTPYVCTYMHTIWLDFLRPLIEHAIPVPSWQGEVRYALSCRLLRADKASSPPISNPTNIAMLRRSLRSKPIGQTSSLKIIQGELFFFSESCRFDDADLDDADLSDAIRYALKPQDTYCTYMYDFPRRIFFRLHDNWLLRSTFLSPGFQPDLDDISKSSITFSLFGRPGFTSLIVAQFDSTKCLMTFNEERNPSVSANCNALLSLVLDSEEYQSKEAAIEKVANFVCDCWRSANDFLDDKWVRLIHT